MHRLFEVDGVEDLDPVAFLQKGVADLQNRGTFRVLSIRNKKKVSCF